MLVESDLTFDRTISEGDHMKTAGEEAYFRTSLSGLRCVLDGLEAAGVDVADVGSVLDFGSGYGRVYRVLTAQFENASTTACDLMVDAARFCADTFGGDFAESTEDLESLALPRKYDLVWLGSVFTHLPEPRWTNLLNFLSKWTTENGVVVFTSHGTIAMTHLENVVLKRNPYLVDAEIFEQAKLQVAQGGFAFAANPTGAIAHQNRMGMTVTEGEYGFSFAGRQWVEDLVEGSESWELVDFTDGGWGNNHDSVTLAKRTNTASTSNRRSTD